MKVTGYKLQHAIREMTHVRDIAAQHFTEGLRVFEGDEYVHPVKAMTMFQKAEDKIARLQTAQAQFNLAVTVDVQGISMPLARAVKLVGGAGRQEKMWRSCAKDTGKDKYSYRENTRDAGVKVAQRTVTVEEATNYARTAGRWASALREAIQVANATEADVNGLTPKDFE